MARRAKASFVDTAPYIPALRYGWLTFLYDPLLKWVGRESTFKRRLVEEARVKNGQRILDLGCGTATLTIIIKRRHPESEVVGLDGDPRILEIARAKVAKTGFDITLNQGMAFDLPYADDSFDRVFSSLLFHHLNRENKIRTLREVFRVLRPQGELHVVDFGKPQNILTYLISLVVRFAEETSDNIKGLLPEMFRNAGFEQVEETARYTTIFGGFSLYRAQKNSSEVNSNWARKEDGFQS